MSERFLQTIQLTKSSVGPVPARTGGLSMGEVSLLMKGKPAKRRVMK
jgi:hypothetical protein